MLVLSNVKYRLSYVVLIEGMYEVMFTTATARHNSSTIELSDGGKLGRVLQVIIRFGTSLVYQVGSMLNLVLG